MLVSDLYGMCRHLDELGYGDHEVRIGDVSEQDDLHCGVGKVVSRSDKVIFITSGDQIWRDETIASSVHASQLWPEEDADED